MEQKPPRRTRLTLLEFMVGTRQAYLASGEQTAEVRFTLAA